MPFTSLDEVHKLTQRGADRRAILDGAHHRSDRFMVGSAERAATRFLDVNDVGAPDERRLSFLNTAHTDE
jgi:hypothetical protein